MSLCDCVRLWWCTHWWAGLVSLWWGRGAARCSAPLSLCCGWISSAPPERSPWPRLRGWKLPKPETTIPLTSTSTHHDAVILNKCTRFPVSLTILESLSTSCIAERISWSRSLADFKELSEAVMTPPHPSPPHLVAPSSPVQPNPPQVEPGQLSPSAEAPHVYREQKHTQLRLDLCFRIENIVP